MNPTTTAYVVPVTDICEPIKSLCSRRFGGDQKWVKRYNTVPLHTMASTIVPTAAQIVDMRTIYYLESAVLSFG